jgi:PAS domain S-box-containing protein
MERPLRNSRLLYFLLSGLTFLGLYLASRYNYLLFHSLAEVFSIVVACGIFMIAWNARRFLDNNYLLFIGVAYLFVAILDFLHTLAYKGMNVFQGYQTNLPTQLWIAARYLESLSLLIAPFFLRRKLKINSVFIGYTVVVGLLLVSIFYWESFPVCFIEGVGLTPFKKISEYVISLILLASVALLVKNRSEFEKGVLLWLVWSIILTIVSELAFTLYVDAYGVLNQIGHFLKIVSFYLIYKAIIETGLTSPYSLLLRNLKQSEAALRRSRDELEIRVQERTAELAKSNQALQIEIEERRQAESALRESETKYRIVAENTYDWEWWMSPEDYFVYVSPSCERITGYKAEDFLSDSNFVLSITHPDDRSLFADHLRGVEQTLISAEVEFRILHADGSLRWLAHACQAVFDDEGHFLGRRGSNRDISERKQAEEARRESEARLRLLSSQLMTIQEVERKRVAHELHDGIGQMLTAIKFQIERVLERSKSSRKGEKGPMESLIPLIQESIEEVRRIQMDLRPSTLDDLGVLATVGWFCRRFQTIYSGIQVENEIDIEEEQISNPLKTVVYRVVQEAMNNIAKHSQASLVRLSMKEEDDRIELAIKDNGLGFDLEETLSVKDPNRGFGLASMKERTELSGGSFTIESTRGKGTTVQASWPIG